MRTRDFDKYYAKYAHVIRAIARKLALRDDALAEDLEQEGSFALFQLKPERATSNKDAWIRQAIKNRMIDYLRRLNPKRYDSLDARLEMGDQLEQFEDGTLGLRSRSSDRMTPRDPDGADPCVEAPPARRAAAAELLGDADE